MLEDTLSFVTSVRFDVEFAVLGILGSVLSCASVLALADRIVRTRQVPFAFGRVLSVGIVATCTLATQLLALYAVNDTALLRPPSGARFMALIAIAAAMLIATLYRADEDALEDPRPFTQTLFFGLLALFIHQFAVLPRLIDGFDVLRAAIALGSFALAVALVAPFLELFVGRADARRAAWPGGIVLGLACSLPFVLASYLLYVLRGDVGPPLPDEVAAARWELAALVFLSMAVVHGIGWVLAWRASVRGELARREVRVLQASLDALLDDTPDWVAVLEPDGRVLAAGGAWTRGPVERTLRAGDSLLDALPRPLGSDLRTFLDDARRTPRAAVVREIHFRTPDGEEETAELRIADRTADPQVRGVILVARSRTEQLAQRAELENQRRLYRELFERAPVPMFVVDATTHRIVDANPAAPALYGYDGDALIGREADFFVAGADRSRLWAFRESIHRGTGRRTEMVAEQVRADGTTFQARLLGTQFREAGSLRRLIMVQDVSTYVREGTLQSGEIRLLQTLARSEDLAEDLRAMVAWLGDFPGGDRHAVVLWLERGTIDAGAGVSEAGLEWLRESGWNALAEVLVAGTSVCQPLGAEGEHLWLRPVVDAGGKLIGVVGSGPCSDGDIDDDTDRSLEIAARLAALAAERSLNADVLRHAQRMETLGRVAGSVAHDFNNLLTVILGEADLLREAPELTAESRGNVDSIMESAERASTIGRRLLSISRNQPRRLDDVDLVEALRSSERWFRGVLGEAVRVHLRLLPRPVVVRCDASMFESALLNLAMNARDAMNGVGALEVAVETRTLAAPRQLLGGDLAPGTFAVVHVRDEGPGIAEADLARVLDPFFSTRAGAGTGLGLPVAANFAVESGGSLDIVRRAEGGADVSLWLPLEDGAAALDAPAAPEAPERALRLLVVEDEPLVGRFLARSLERAGYEVDLLPTADEARDRLADGAHFDLVVSDIGLPGDLDGVALARWIAGAVPALPVLLSSGYADAGIDADVPARMLPKPYDARTLVRTVEEMLSGGD